jgi:short subunit dehydrogenase-like uncharacterized protein
VTDDRAHDIVVFGATGFVGRLIADYLAEHAPAGTRIALAGRSEEKLARIRSELSPKAADFPLVVADSSDPESLAAMARDARVVATTVGPYWPDGMALVEACADAGTHYADLTGEVLFVRDSLKHSERAAKTGARIVHSCGFDSIPSDLGVQLVYEKAKEDGAGELEDTTLVVTAIRGAASGGTVASLKGQVDEARANKESRKIVLDPYSLTPDRPPEMKGERDSMGISNDDEVGQWIGPWLMASYNTRIVRLSNSLQDWAYGKGFRYREVMGLGTGPLAPVKAAALAGGLGALTAGLALGPTRKVLDRVLPDPGEGPDEESRRKGFYKMEIHTQTTGGARYVAKLVAQGDPGYAATAVLMGEAALCLALDGDRLPDRAGVLTPATAMNGVLTERLRAAGQTFDVERR